MNTGKILISDLKKDVDKIQAIAKNDRMFAQFLRLNENFVHNVVSKVTAQTLAQLKKTDTNLDYPTGYHLRAAPYRRYATLVHLCRVLPVWHTTSASIR